MLGASGIEIKPEKSDMEFYLKKKKLVGGWKKRWERHGWWYEIRTLVNRPPFSGREKNSNKKTPKKWL